MGARGPVPKRSEERRRQNKESQPEQVQPLVAVVPVPPVNPRWHEIARDWYTSLAESGQSRYFEPSDWQAARFVADAMSRNLRQKQKFSAMLFTTVWSAMNDLLTTEGARRRVRMEIERGGSEEPATVTSISDYRKAMGG